MKCKECSSCYKGFWASSPETYVCISVNSPFVIEDVNSECRIDMFQESFVKTINPKDSCLEILTRYRDLYYAESNNTERGIVARAINDLIVGKYFNKE